MGVVKLENICDFKKGNTGLAKAESGDYPLVTTGAERKTCHSYQFDTKAALPPLSEQKAIVQKVEKLFVICDQLETRITSNQTHAEQLMQAVLQEAFSQTTKPPKYSNKRVCTYDR